MSAFNRFNVIGTVYGNAEKILIPLSYGNTNLNYFSKFTLVVDSSFGKGKNYIPIECHQFLWEKGALLGRNGNILAVEGEIITNEFYNKKDGQVRVQFKFFATNLMLISKPSKAKICRNKFKQVMESSSIEEFQPPKPRKQNKGFREMELKELNKNSTNPKTKL